MDRPSQGFRLDTSLRQEQLLLPQMLVAIEMLELPVQDLERWLLKAAAENEALDVDAPRPSELEATSFSARPASGAKSAGAEASDRHREMLESQPDRGPSLTERIDADLALLDDPSEIVEWVRFLVSTLDERGYLSLPDELLLELGRAAGLRDTPGILGSAIARLQSLEPKGLGARNTIEALVLQIDPTDPDYALLRRLLEEFLEDLAKNKLPAVARALGLELPELATLLERLRELDPRPAAGLVESAAPVIVPDVLCLRRGDGFEIEVARSGLAACGLDSEVVSLSRDREQAPDLRSYLKNKVVQARWILRGLEQRHETLERVARSVFARQLAFLVEGPGHLVPLKMIDLAADLGLAPSTISRTVAGKYAQTPWGIFPLRHFFQASGGGDASVACDELGEAVRELFASEDATAPYSDGEAREELARRGFKIARRTVAKYRQELGIPSSYLRRRFE